MEDKNENIHKPEQSITTDAGNPDSSPQPKKKNKRIILLSGIIIFLLIIIGAYIYKINSDTNKESKNTSNIQNDNKNEELISLENKIIYAKEDTPIDTKVRRFPVYSIYSSTIDGKNKNVLLTVGDESNFVNDFYLIEDEGILIINYEYKLTAYDLNSGTQKDLYAGVFDRNYIFDFAVSNDNKTVAFNLSEGAYFHDPEVEIEPNAKIILVDLETGNSTEILQRTTEETGGFWLSPFNWSSDNNFIFLREAIPAGITSKILRIKRDGTGLKRYEINLNGSASPDAYYYIYLERIGDSSNFDCVGHTSDTIKIYDFINEEDKTIESNNLKVFKIDAWSPDSSQFMYSTSLYKSGTGCFAESYPEESFIYDVKSNQIEKIDSKESILEKWQSDKPNILIQDSEAKNNTEFYYNDILIDTNPGIHGNGKIEYLGTL